MSKHQPQYKITAVAMTIQETDCCDVHKKIARYILGSSTVPLLDHIYISPQQLRFDAGEVVSRVSFKFTLQSPFPFAYPPPPPPPLLRNVHYQCFFVHLYHL